MKPNPIDRYFSWTQILLLAVMIIASASMTIASADESYAANASSESSSAVESGTVPGYLAGQVVVRFANENIAARMLSRIDDADTIGHLQFAPVYLLQYDPGVNPDSSAQQLAAQNGVDYAHPNFVTDSSHGVEGSRPIGDVHGNGKYKDQPAADMLDLDVVHPITTGDGVRIGVIDGGIQFDHPLFELMSFDGYDFVDDDEYAYDEPGGEISGHGTFVAGVLHLVAPDAELVPYRVIDTCGHGDGFTMARAIERAVTDNCKLINISLALTGRHWAVKDALEYAELNNVMVVIAAGNESAESASYPAAERASLGVAAIDSLYVLAEFSNYGDDIDLCAPGVELYSTYLDSIYAWWSGTSFAAPCVTGQLALLAQLYPPITLEEYTTIISEKSINLEQYNPGYEGMLGYGMIDTDRAMVAAGVLAIETRYFPIDTSITITLTPDRLEDSSVIRRSWDFIEWVTVESSNGPAVFTGEMLWSSNQFAEIFVPYGVTGSPARIIFNAENIYRPGVFINTAAFRVAGLSTPLFLEIELTVTRESTQITLEQVDEFGVRNYPNPFNPSTTIQFGLPEACYVNLKIYNVLGQEVTCLTDRWMPAGQHQVDWRGTNSRGEPLGSGMYFYRLEMGERVETRKMILVK
jgi:hypothetical protein